MGSVINSGNTEMTDDKNIGHLFEINVTQRSEDTASRTGRNVVYCGLLLCTATEIEANKIHCF